MTLRWLVYITATLVMLGPFALGLPRAYHELTGAAAARSVAAAGLPAARRAAVTLPLRRPEP